MSLHHSNVLPPPVAIARWPELRDRRCEEVVARFPGSTGHCWVRARLDGLSVRQAAAAIAAAIEAPAEVVVSAGGRDRRAQALAWFSFAEDAANNPNAATSAGFQRRLKVVETRACGRAVRPGDVTALAWRTVLRGAAAGDGYRRVKAALDAVRVAGLPNRLDPDPDLARLGRLVAQGRPLPARVRAAGGDRHRCLAAFRDGRFDAWVDRRIAEGLFTSSLPGDQLQVHLNRPPAERAIETVTEAAAADRRIAAAEAVVLGPVFGKDLPEAGGEALLHEEAVLAEAGVDRSAFAGLPGWRRPISFRPTEARVEIEGPDLLLTCRLPVEVRLDALLRFLVVPAAGEAPC